MRLGSNGLAYFVDDVASLFVESDSESVTYQPLIRARSADDLNGEILIPRRTRRRHKKSRKELSTNNCQSTNRPDDVASSPDCLSDGEIDSFRREVSLHCGDEGNSTGSSDLSQICPKDLTLTQSYPGAQNSGLDGIYLEDLVAQSADQSIRNAYLYVANSNDNAVSSLNALDAGYKSDSEHGIHSTNATVQNLDIQMSLCGLSPDAQVDYDRFCAHLVTFEDFSKDPSNILADPKLVLLYNGKYYNWQTAAPLILSRACFRSELPYSSVVRLEETLMPKKRPRRRTWFTWGNSEPEPESEKPVEITPEEPPTIKSAVPSVSSLPNEAQRSPKRIIPTFSEIEAFCLQPGVNNIEFRIVTKYQGTAICPAKIYLWRWDEKLVVSDVDGTITKSDFLGHVIPALFGSDYGHDGVAELFSKVAENGYKFVYLTARAIGQANTTRNYLGRVCQCEKFHLPDGPVLLSPSSLFNALHREVIAGTPEVFKISCLKELREIFPAEASPFYAAFGNRVNDVTAYIESGFDPGRIFTVNPNGELKNERIPNVKKSFGDVTSLVDHFFPPIPPKPVDVDISDSEDDASTPINTISDVDMSVYSSFAFWRDPLLTTEAALAPQK
ncbi:hypothetical protein Aperf_G00000101541 [Anoplocephala perfoliata]